jgi:hypothetical protein
VDLQAKAEGKKVVETVTKLEGMSLAKNYEADFFEIRYNFNKLRE